MAKWGEGDPRWIVEERPDAVNVNNWHWTEKNACNWSKTKFKELFNGLTIQNSVIQCKINEVAKCEGEAVANNRKGKLIFFYEWDITLKWKGKLVSETKQVTGKINIPNLSEENEVHEVDVNITIDESTPEAETVKDVLRAIGVDKIREQLGKYVQGLKAEFSQGMILPCKDSSNDNSKTKDSINNLSAGGRELKVQANNMNHGSAASLTPLVKRDEHKISTTTLEIYQKFQCTGPELYNALTSTEMVASFTHSPVKLDLKKGGEFEFFGGNIYGQFIELVPNSKIVQTWRFKRWPEDHFSTVTIDIIQQADHTELKLRQTGVPIGEADKTKENWSRYYWESMKRTFGFGCFI